MGYSGGIFYGYKFCNNIRVEGELSFRNDRLKNLSEPEAFTFGKKKKKHFHMHSVQLMANALYDFDLHPCWTPYLGAGIGYVHLQNNNHYEADRVALQAIGGLSYKILPKTELGLEYRYVKAWRVVDNISAVVAVRQYF
jgi:opacity protein-like surface antigen